MAYLCSRPPGWDVRQPDLMRVMNLSEQRLRNAMRELIDAGYVKLERVHTSNGKLAGTQYVFTYEAGRFYDEEPQIRESDKPRLTKYEPRETQALNNIEYNTNISNNQDREINKKPEVKKSQNLLFPDDTGLDRKTSGDTEFERIWKEYPQEGRVGKAKCKEVFDNILKGKGSRGKKIQTPTIESINIALQYYKTVVLAPRQNGFTPAPKHMMTWLNSEPWQDVPHDFNPLKPHTIRNTAKPFDPFKAER